MAKKYVVKKFDGDDKYSYAVFYAKSVKGQGTIIFWGQAAPIVSGLSRNMALHYKKELEKKDKRV